MSVRLVGPERHFSAESRATKNAAITATIRATKARRKSQDCRSYTLKIVTNRLSASQAEALSMLFVEARWLRNAIVGSEDVFSYIIGSSVTVKVRDSFEERDFRFLGSQMKQSVLDEVKSNIRSLAASKRVSCKVGRLRFTSSVRSVHLKQYNTTYKFKSIDQDQVRVKVQNVPGWITIRGMSQIPTEAEFANAKILNKPDGYYIAVTVFLNANDFAQAFQPGTVVGVDMGLKTSITLSNGTKISASIGETERLRRLQRKLSRQVKGSNGWRATRVALLREHQYITNIKDDVANKVVHVILQNELVFIQDENIKSWHRKNGYIRGARTVQRSILGRVKSKLVNHPRVAVVSRFVATTATCICGVQTSHGVELRTFVCSACGYTDDRDVHAAKNMIRLGSQQIPAERREYTLVESVSDWMDQDFGSWTAQLRSLKPEASQSSASDVVHRPAHLPDRCLGRRVVPTGVEPVTCRASTDRSTN